MWRFYLPMCLMAFAGCVPEQEIVEKNPFRISEGGKPWVIAHGGAKQLWPENTMLAFNGSVDIGVDALEMDVRLTKDEVLVLHHDETIDRMSDGSGKVIDFDFVELLSYNFGETFQDLNGNIPYKDSLVQITKLDELMAKYGHMPFVIEIKDEGEAGEKAADLLKILIDKYDLKNRVIVASFYDDVIAYFNEIGNGEYYVSTPKRETTKLVLTSRSRTGLFFKPEAVATQVPTKSAGINIAKKRVVNSAHKHNLAVHYWTINNKEQMKELIEIGADGLITDRPDLMNELLTEMGF